MVGTIDSLGGITQAPIVAPAPKDPTAPTDTPDLRDTQAAIQGAQQSAAAQADRAAKDPANISLAQGAEKELENAINERLAKVLRSNVRLSVEIDKGTGDFVYKSIDKKTGAVDRQYPAESILRMLAFFKELDGLIYDKKA